jgi:hypothetical protein
MKLKAKAYLRIAAKDWRKKYNSVWSFSEGLAGVELDDRHGYVDKTGKEYWDMYQSEAREQMKNR